jgi:hypothetical protein
VSSPVIAWCRIPTMSFSSVLTFLPAGNCLTLNSLLRLPCLSRHGQQGKHGSSIAVQLLLSWPRRKHHSSVVCWQLPCNGRLSRGRRLATSLHATILYYSITIYANYHIIWLRPCVAEMYCCKLNESMGWVVIKPMTCEAVLGTTLCVYRPISSGQLM